MINPQDHIRYSNVVSRKYRFHYHDLNMAINDFIGNMINLAVTFKGPLFYSVNNVPMEEKVNIELFMPIEEDGIGKAENFQFHSYYSIEDMVSITIHNNIEQETQIAYKLLLEYIEGNGLQQATPIYHIVSGDQDFQYVMIKIGTAKVS
jgi:effector-binding domain-containing protein